MEKKEKKPDYRWQVLQCLFYEDSAVEGWKNYLLDVIPEVYISPAHDKDLKEDNTYKKTHWHVVCDMKSKKSLEQFKEIVSPVGGVVDMRMPYQVKYPDVHGSIVHSKAHAIRYLIHIDNPEKAQYDKNEIIHGGTGDIDDYFKISNKTQTVALSEMIDNINEFNICYYSDWLDYCRNHKFEWFELMQVPRVGVIISEYIKSKQIKLTFDPKTN